MPLHTPEQEPPQGAIVGPPIKLTSRVLESPPFNLDKEEPRVLEYPPFNLETAL